MATATATPVTAENFGVFVGRPENIDRSFELERGEILELPPPKKPHGVVCANVAAILHAYSLSSGRGYVTSNDSGFITERNPDSVRGPDVAYWIDAELAAEGDPEYTQTPPVIAVEVVSPDDRVNNVVRKSNEYLSSGVSQVWVIDPMARDVAIYRDQRSPLFLSENDELDGAPELPGFRRRVADFFHALLDRVALPLLRRKDPKWAAIALG